MSTTWHWTVWNSTDVKTWKNLTLTHIWCWYRQLRSDSRKMLFRKIFWKKKKKKKRKKKKKDPPPNKQTMKMLTVIMFCHTANFFKRYIYIYIYIYIFQSAWTTSSLKRCLKLEVGREKKKVNINWKNISFNISWIPQCNANIYGIQQKAIDSSDNLWSLATSQ